MAGNPKLRTPKRKGRNTCVADEANQCRLAALLFHRLKRFEQISLRYLSELAVDLRTFKQTALLKVVQIAACRLLRNTVIIHVGLSFVVIRRVASRRLEKGDLTMVEPAWWPHGVVLPGPIM
jgi:hypothetical protein